MADTIGSLVFAWVAAVCIAEAHAFAGLLRGLAVVLAMAVLVLALVAFVIIL